MGKGAAMVHAWEGPSLVTSQGQKFFWEPPLSGRLWSAIRRAYSLGPPRGWASP